jgi:hypothetical protein
MERRARRSGEADEKAPYRVRLPGFVGKEVGLGDAIKRATTRVGVPPCGGCGRRAERLNRSVVLSPWRR